MKRETRNPEKTKKIILQKATKLFVKNGYNGTSISQITEATGYNKRMVYHYFKSKDGLYQTIYKSKLDSFYKILGDNSFEDKVGDSLEEIKDVLFRVIENLFDVLAADQDLVKLLLWNELEEGTSSRGIWKNVSEFIFSRINNLLGHAVDKGYLNKSFHTGQIMLTLYGMITFYFTHNKLSTLIIGKDKNSIEKLKSQKALISYFVNGLFVDS